MNDYTLVLGVDRKHLEQLRLVLPTWIKHKPSLLNQPIIVFYDWEEVTATQIRSTLPISSYQLTPWPIDGIKYGGDPDNKWWNPQRWKMFSGFIHVAAQYVKTKYWLKVDTDVVATGQDSWIDRHWFDDDPGIVCQSWGYTKPPDQMQQLDAWAHQKGIPYHKPPLGLVPKPSDNKLKHPRIISWCGFFETDLTRLAAAIADEHFEKWKIPVASQDGYIWYTAMRMGREVRRVDMKQCGWLQRNSMSNIRQAVEESLK